MTPDKIYLNTPKIQPELDNTTWDTKTYADCENVEYVRKDVVDEMVKSAEDHAFFAGQEKLREKLLEWAKEHKCVIETHGDERDAYLRGEYSVLNSLIDKLNSM